MKDMTPRKGDLALVVGVRWMHRCGQKFPSGAPNGLVVQVTSDPLYGITDEPVNDVRLPSGEEPQIATRCLIRLPDDDESARLFASTKAGDTVGVGE